jgi:hypothetical protein
MPTAGGMPSTNQTPGKRWIECGLLMDARGSVRNLEFAPNAFGLKLVSSPSYPHLGSADACPTGNDLDGLVPSDIYLPLAKPRRLATHKHRLPPLASILPQRKKRNNRRRPASLGSRWSRRRIGTDGFHESIERECAESGKGE